MRKTLPCKASIEGFSLYSTLDRTACKNYQTENQTKNNLVIWEIGYNLQLLHEQASKEHIEEYYCHILDLGRIIETNFFVFKIIYGLWWVIGSLWFWGNW